LVKPVNEFITPVKADAEMDASPYMKLKDEPKQTGLFDLFARAEEQDAAEDNIIKYDLNEEAPSAEETNHLSLRLRLPKR
jgi:cell division protein FtsZ